MKNLCTLPPTARLAGRKTVVKCQLINDFLKVKDLLSSESINFFTYRLASEKKKLFVIRGLPINTEIKDIIESLADQGVRVSRVTQMKTTKPTQNQSKENIKIVPPRLIPLFTVDLENETLLEDFISIKYICGLRITVEKHKSPKGPPQCYRCQAFGHVEKACHMPPRCVKCGKNHLTVNCEMPRTLEAKCANCQGNHPANYRGCSAYLRVKERINKLKLKSQEKELERGQIEKTTLDKDENREEENKTAGCHSYAEIVKKHPSKEVDRNTGNSVSGVKLPAQTINSQIDTDQFDETLLSDDDKWRDDVRKWIYQLSLLILKSNITKAEFIGHVMKISNILYDE
ncbi:hypothetical protein J437_LFUL015999 [Ladona fulva]|uniref:Pre-C2HC domain-containing protein n=1 Tax=Ladona fulva TaxID=123851 RepID=A0A8K0KKF8_LADFU|nr:hypothetical protein J437_LFUL015999 [Ladona fulva]